MNNYCFFVFTGFALYSLLLFGETRIVVVGEEKILFPIKSSFLSNIQKSDYFYYYTLKENKNSDFFPFLTVCVFILQT
jgi:hypothetical protein